MNEPCLIRGGPSEFLILAPQPGRSNHLAASLRGRDRKGKSGKSGATHHTSAPILERPHVTGEGRLRPVHDCSRLFRRSVGTPTSLRREADKWGPRRMAGISHSRVIRGGIDHPRPARSPRPTAAPLPGTARAWCNAMAQRAQRARREPRAFCRRQAQPNRPRAPSAVSTAEEGSGALLGSTLSSNMAVAATPL
jgi:hypothetical protein